MCCDIEFVSVFTIRVFDFIPLIACAQTFKLRILFYFFYDKYFCYPISLRNDLFVYKKKAILINLLLNEKTLFFINFI